MSIPITLHTRDTVGHQTKALIDSGATGMFISRRLVKELRLPTSKLERPIGVFNVDGTANKIGEIHETTTIYVGIGKEQVKTRLYITEIGKQDVILGMTWLKEHNPDIDWATVDLTLSCCMLPIHHP